MREFLRRVIIALLLLFLSALFIESVIINCICMNKKRQ